MLSMRRKLPTEKKLSARNGMPLEDVPEKYREEVRRLLEAE